MNWIIYLFIATSCSQSVNQSVLLVGVCVGKWTVPRLFSWYSVFATSSSRRTADCQHYGYRLWWQPLPGTVRRSVLDAINTHKCTYWPIWRNVRMTQFTHTHTHTTVLLLFWNMSGTTRVSRYQKGKTRQVKNNLDLLEQEIVSGSGICWAIYEVCTSSQTITPTSHHSVFYRPDALPAAQPTASKHWRQWLNSLDLI